MVRFFAVAAALVAAASSAFAQSPGTVPAPVPQAPQQSPGTVPAPQPASPQQQQLQVDIPSIWRVECVNNGTALDCQTSQSAMVRQTQQVIATVTVRVPVGAPRQPVLVVQVPLGVRVTDPITLAVDESAPESYTVQGCTNNGCFAGGSAAPALIERLRAGQSIRISFLNLGGDTVAVTMPLRGFAVAHDKIK